MNEEEAMKAYREEGIDLAELEEKKEEETPEPQPEAPKEEEKEEEAPLQDESPKVERKRSIYDEYKEKKAELKSEREQREAAEREASEWRTRYEALTNASTPEERQEAQDDIDAFAREINADPDALRRMRELFLKDVKPAIDPSLSKDLEEFKAWKRTNAELVEKQMFEEEFRSVTPTLKELLPGANDEEMQEVRKELYRLSHTQEYHDKDLAYIAWKHRTELSALISPKKRGMESRGITEASEESFDFNPNPDFSRMTDAELAQWEETYKKMAENEGLKSDANGRRILI